MNRVLIIKLWALGDVLISTPMIAALRATHPDVKIAWCIDSSHGEILRGHPGIDELIALDTGSWRRLLRRGKLAAWLRRTTELRREMVDRRFDAVINCHPEKWWTAALCAAPIRVGLFPSSTLPASRRFYSKAIARPQTPPVHETIHYLLATRALGCPDAALDLTIGETADEEAFLQEFSQRHGLSPEAACAVIAPFTTAATKTWEPERYAELAARLSDSKPNTRVILTIGPKDGEAARYIAAQAARAGSQPPIIAEGTTLRQYVALLRRADVVISGDTSALHIAAALGTPFVALFGSTDPAKLAPLRGEGTVLFKPLPCGPCYSARCVNSVFRECLKRISVTEALAAAEPYLRATAQRRTRLPVL